MIMPESEFTRNMDSESPGWRKVVDDPLFKKWLDDNDEKDFYSHLTRRHLHYVSMIMKVYNLTTRIVRRNLKTMNTSTTAKPKMKWELDRFKAGKELNVTQ